LKAGLVDAIAKVIMKKKDYLASGHCWKMTAPKDFNKFLLALPKILPPESVLCIEACRTPIHIREFLLTRKAPVTKILPRGTILPISEVFHLVASDENLKDFEAVISASDSSGIPTHIQAYNRESILLQWFDASADDPLFISKKIREDLLKEFCTQLGSHLSEI